MPIGDQRNVVTDTNGSVLDPLYQTQSPAQPRPQDILSGIGQGLGIQEAITTMTGGTPEEQQMFALGAMPMLLAPEAKALEGAVSFAGKLPKYAEELFSEGGATIHKLQKPGRWPTFVATSPNGEAYQFKDFDKAKQWVAPPQVQRPDPPASPGELPPWEDETQYSIMGYHGTQSSQPIEKFETGNIYDDAGNLIHAGSGDPSAFIGPHFSAEPRVAGKFAEGKGAAGSDWLKSRYTEGAPSIYPVKLHGGKVKKFKSEDVLNDFIYDHNVSTREVERILEDQFDGDLEAGGNKYDNDANYRSWVNREAVQNELDYDEPSQETAEALGSAAKSALEGEGWTTIQYPNAVEGGTSYIAIKRPLSRYTGAAMSGAALAVGLSPDQAKAGEVVKFPSAGERMHGPVNWDAVKQNILNRQTRDVLSRALGGTPNVLPINPQDK